MVGDIPEQRGLVAERQQAAARGRHGERARRAHVQHAAHVGARRVHRRVQGETWGALEGTVQSEIIFMNFSYWVAEVNAALSLVNEIN